MAYNITSANASLVLSVGIIFPSPQVIQDFSSDDMVEGETVNVAETMIGVDGHMSAGWLPAIRTVNITLMGASPSNAFFDSWAQYCDANQTVVFCNGVLTVPAVNMTYELNNGVIESYVPLSQLKKVIQPRKYGLKFESITGSRF